MQSRLMGAIFLAASIPAWSQGPPIPRFDVATVKPSDPKGGGINNRTLPDRFIYTNATLKVLVSAAYELRNYQIVGGPSWFDTDRWDIEGKTASALPQAGRFDAMLRMMQPLIEERFRLKHHREMRDLPMYSLVVGKNGHKLRRFDPNDPNAPKGLRTPNGEVSGVADMAMLAFYLSGQIGLPIENKTELEGRYVFSLKYAPESLNFSPPGDEQQSIYSNRPSLFTAVQEQLGLRLEGRKGPVDVMVIDSAQRPSEN